MPALGWKAVAHQFDDFVLDPRTRRLLRRGAEVHLSPKAFDLLTLLVARHERAVAKTELQDVLWPSTHVLDTSIAGLIAEIRRALGDAADSPRYVRTVSRFGYWFVRGVQQYADGESAAAGRYWLVSSTRQIALNSGDNIVGRAPDATVWIDAAGVSRRHARICLNGTQATVEDLGSKNGTYLRGQQIMQMTSLADGDEIRLGSVVMTFRIPPPAGSTVTANSTPRTAQRRRTGRRPDTCGPTSGRGSSDKG